MTRPTWGVRLVGKPHVCLLLIAFYSLLVWGWYEGDVRWWVGLLALCFAQQAFRCYRQLKNYNAWLAQWNDMLVDEDAVGRRQAVAPAPLSRRSRLSRYVLTASVIVAAGVPIVLPADYWTHSDAFVSAWLLSCGCIAVRAVRAMFRRNRQPKAISKKAAKAQDFVVAWALDRPSASPSWQAARQQVPEYCAYLLGLAASSPRPQEQPKPEAGMMRRIAK